MGTVMDFFQPVVGSSDVAGSKISGAILKQFTKMFKQNIREATAEE